MKYPSKNTAKKNRTFDFSCSIKLEKDRLKLDRLVI